MDKELLDTILTVGGILAVFSPVCIWAVRMLVKQAVDQHLKEHADLMRELRDSLKEKQADTDRELLELKGDIRVIAERVRHENEATTWTKK